MKKVLCIILALMFCMSFAACGKDGGDDNATKDSASPTSASSDASTSVSSTAGSAESASSSSVSDKAVSADSGSADSGSGDNGSAGYNPAQKFSSIEEYLNDPKVKANIDEQVNEMSDKFTMRVYADADALVYEFNYVAHIEDGNIDSTRSMLESSLEENADTFTGVIDELKKYVDIESPQVRVIYNNDDGANIVEKTFS